LHLLLKVQRRNLYHDAEAFAVEVELGRDVAHFSTQLQQGFLALR
jgi:hypothetical protein